MSAVPELLGNTRPVRAEPDRAVVRRMVHALLKTDSDFVGFCVDHHPDIERRFTQGMDREDKINLLLKLSEPNEVVAWLRERLRNERDESGLATLEHLLAQPRNDFERRARELWQRLEPLYQERERLLQVGQSLAAVDDQIRKLKREQRQGSQLPEGEVLKDRYRLIEIIGSGGFGKVYKAFDRVRCQVVAIKILHTDQLDEARRVERFERGAREMQKLNHKSIVRLLDDPAEHNGFLFFVMEYLPGGDLFRAVLNRTISREAALRAIQQVGEALSYAHGRGLIHRDIKPHNILLDTQGDARLTDFDLVWASDTTGGTRTGAMGTYLFASPEEMDDASRIDHRADIYSLGMTTLFVLLGENLSPKVILTRHLYIDGLLHPERLKALLRQTTALDPDDRPPSMDAFLAELAAAVQDSAGLSQQEDDKGVADHVLSPNLSSSHPHALPANLPVSSDPARRLTTIVSLGVALALVALGLFFILRAFVFVRIPTDPDAQKILSEIEADLQGRRWKSVIDKASELLVSPGVSTKVKEAALIKKARAELEAKSKQVYDRFSADGGSGHYAQALLAYRELPDNSIYLELARSQYDQIFSLFVESHLKAAEDARAQGRCGEFQSQLQAILSVDSKQVQALAAKNHLCASLTAAKPSELTKVAQGVRGAKAKLAQADAAYAKCKYLEAMNLARAGASAEPAHASRLIGLAACKLKLRDEAREAYLALQEPDRQAVLQTCRENNILAGDLLTISPKARDESNAAVTSKVAVDPGVDVDTKLSEAQTEYVNGNYTKAIEMAKSVQKGSPVRAWRIIGSAACKIKDLKLVNDAYRRLDAPGRQYIVYVCQRNHIRNIGNRFRLSDE